MYYWVKFILIIYIYSILRTCGNLAEFGLKEEYQDNLNEELLFGFLNFSDFFLAFYIVLQFTLLTGWSQITYNVNLNIKHKNIF